VVGITTSETVRSELGVFGFLLPSIRYVVIWAVFTAMYWVIPNTRVKFRYAVLGGVVAGTLWLLTSAAYAKFMFGLPRYSVIYSSVALFPLFLMWVYFSWIILLFGAELSFAYQNEKTFAMERLSAGASQAYREALGIRAMTEVAQRFETAQPGLVSAESAREWGVPTRLLNDTLETLTETGLVQKCATQPITYQPGRSVDKITVGDVVRALRDSGREPSDLRADPDLRPILDEVNGVDNSLMNTSLADVIQQDLLSNATRTQKA
jgi:membrane protein